MVDAAGGHVAGDEVEGDVFEDFFVVAPVPEGDFGDVGKDPAIDEVAANAGEEAFADGEGEGGGRKAGDEGVDFADAVVFEDGVEVADVGLDDVDIFESGEALLEDFGEVTVAFDGDEFGVGFEAVENLGGDGAGAGAEFDDDFGFVPVDLFDGGAGEGFGGGPEGGDGGAVAEEFAEEEEVVGDFVFLGDGRLVGGVGHGRDLRKVRDETRRVR